MGARISAGRWVASITLRHGEGLARAGDAQQHLVALLRADALRPVRRWRWAGRRRARSPPTSLNFLPPSDFSGRAGRCGVHERRRADWGRRVRVAIFNDSTVAAAPVMPRGCTSSPSAGSNRAWGWFGEALRLADQRGIEQRRQMVAERVDFRFLKPLARVERGADFEGLGIAPIWGRTRREGKGGGRRGQRTSTGGGEALGPRATCSGSGISGVVMARSSRLSGRLALESCAAWRISPCPRPSRSASAIGWLTAGGLRVPCALGPAGIVGLSVKATGLRRRGRSRCYGRFSTGSQRPPATFGSCPAPRPGLVRKPASPHYNRPVRLPAPLQDHMWRDDQLYDLTFVLD